MVQAVKTKKIFDDKYEILAIVGRGRFSVIYHARHIVAPTSDVALKVLLEEKDFRSLSERLRKEALAMVSARHKYVIRLDDFNSVGNLCYLSMEYAPESDLRKFTQSKGGKLPITQVELFLRQATEGLAFIHKAGIIHRDIKADNILVINERETRLADFGVAVLPTERSTLEDLQKGVGTMDYMGPEVLEGTRYDKSSDVYALGVTFYELLTGRHPFEHAPLIEQLSVRQDGNYPAIRDVNPQVSENIANILSRAMSYDSNKRYSSAIEMLAALNGLKRTDGAAIPNLMKPMLVKPQPYSGFQETGPQESTTTRSGGNKAAESAATVKTTLEENPQSLPFSQSVNTAEESGVTAAAPITTQEPSTTAETPPVPTKLEESPQLSPVADASFPVSNPIESKTAAQDEPFSVATEEIKSEDSTAASLLQPSSRQSESNPAEATSDSSTAATRADSAPALDELMALSDDDKLTDADLEAFENLLYAEELRAEEDASEDLTAKGRGDNKAVDYDADDTSTDPFSVERSIADEAKQEANSADDFNGSTELSEPTLKHDQSLQEHGTDMSTRPPSRNFASAAMGNTSVEPLNNFSADPLEDSPAAVTDSNSPRSSTQKSENRPALASTQGTRVSVNAHPEMPPEFNSASRKPTVTFDRQTVEEIKKSVSGPAISLSRVSSRARHTLFKFGGAFFGVTILLVGLKLMTASTPEQDTPARRTSASATSQAQSASSFLPTFSARDGALQGKSLSELPSGIYVGSVQDFIPNRVVPLTVISNQDRAEMAFILGIEGFSPQVVSLGKIRAAAPVTQGTDGVEIIPIRVRANGLVLKFNSEFFVGDQLTGEVENSVDGTTGSWILTPLR